MKYKKPMLCGGLVLCGTLGALGAFGDHFTERNEKVKELLHQTKTVSGEITHIDEDSYATFGYRSGSNITFENIRVEEKDGLVHKLIYLGPSSYKIGDKVKKLEYKCLEDKGILLGNLNYLLTLRTMCQTGYVEADGIITENLPSNIRNYLFPR